MNATPHATGTGTETLDRLLEVLDHHEMEVFIATFAGTNVLFGKRPTGPFFARLVAVLGEGAAGRLCGQFPGEQVYIPLSGKRSQRDAIIRARLASGESIASVARSVGLSVVHVRRISWSAPPSSPRIAAGISKVDTTKRDLGAHEPRSARVELVDGPEPPGPTARAHGR